MRSRNQLIGHESRRRLAQDVKASKFRAVLYHYTQGDSKLFEDEEEYNKALLSKEWVDSPAKVDVCNDPDLIDEDVLSAGMFDDVSVEVPELKGELDKKVNWAKKLKLAESNRRGRKKYISQMNVDRLIIEARKWGLNYDNYYQLPKGDRPKKYQMVIAIKHEIQKKTGIEVT